MSALGDLAEFLADRLPEVGGRVLPVKIDQDEPRPAVTYTEQSNSPIYDLNGETGHTELTADYVVWADNYTTAEGVLDKVRLILTKVRDETIGGTVFDCVILEPTDADTFDLQEGFDEGVYSKGVRFFIRYQRAVASVLGV